AVAVALLSVCFAFAAWAVVADVNFTPKENANAIPGAKVTIEISEPAQEAAEPKTETAEKKPATAEQDSRTATPPSATTERRRPLRRVEVTASPTGQVTTK